MNNMSDDHTNLRIDLSRKVYDILNSTDNAKDATTRIVDMMSIESQKSFLTPHDAAQIIDAATDFTSSAVNFERATLVKEDGETDEGHQERIDAYQRAVEYDRGVLRHRIAKYSRGA